MKNKKNENKEGEPWSALLLYCIMMTDSAGEFKLKRKMLYADKKVKADLRKKGLRKKFFNILKKIALTGSCSYIIMNRWLAY